MFKKQIKIGGQNQLSGKDRKNLKSEMLKQLKQEVVQQFFIKNQKIICEKVSGQKALIYMTDEYPAFVDGTGKGDFFPTIYLLNSYPGIMKSLILNEGVETYIFNGANLMWPGVKDFSELQDFNKDEVVAIQNAKGEFVAIAAVAISKKQLNQQTKKGIACYILHYLNDKLWQHGPKTIPQIVIPKVKKIVEPKKVEPQIKKIEIKQQKVEKVEKIEKQSKNQKTKKIEEEPEVKKNDKKGDKKKDQKIQSVPVEEEPKKKEQLKKKQIKQQVKKQEPKVQVKVIQKKVQQPVEESSSEDQDLGSLLHKKNQRVIVNKPVVTIKQQGKKENVFSDEQDDKKKKKGGHKKGPQIQQPQQQQQQIKKKKQQSNDQQQQQQQKEKNKNKKNKASNKLKKKQQSDQEDLKNKKKKKKKNEISDDQQPKQQQQKSAIATQIMDQYFKQSFLNALKLGLSQDDLPIDFGYFYTEFILLARKQGVVLDIKNSSYKKINKFLQLMQKEGFIETKQGKGKNGSVGPTIIRINYDNQQLKNFVPTIKAMSKREAHHHQQQDDQKLKFKMNSTIQVNDVFRPKAIINSLFKKQGQEKQEKQNYYTAQQIKEYINKYLGQQQNNQKSKKKQKSQKYVYLNYSNNPLLKQLLKQMIQQHQQQLAREQKDPNNEGQQKQQPSEQKKKKKQRETRDKNIIKVAREDFQKRVFQQTQTFYQIKDKQNQINQVKQGKFRLIQISAEKANNKNVTKIVGLQNFLVPKKKADQLIAILVQSLQHKFSCSVSTLNLPGKNGGKEITVHGNFLDELVDMFTQQHKIKKQFIVTINKLDKKKKN